MPNGSAGPVHSEDVGEGAAGRRVRYSVDTSNGRVDMETADVERSHDRNRGHRPTLGSRGVSFLRHVRRASSFVTSPYDRKTEAEATTLKLEAGLSHLFMFASPGLYLKYVCNAVLVVLKLNITVI